MVVSALPDARRGSVRGRGEVAHVVGLCPGDVPRGHPDMTSTQKGRGSRNTSTLQTINIYFAYREGEGVQTLYVDGHPCCGRSRGSRAAFASRRLASARRPRGRSGGCSTRS